MDQASAQYISKAIWPVGAATKMNRAHGALFLRIASQLLAADAEKNSKKKRTAWPNPPAHGPAVN